MTERWIFADLVPLYNVEHGITQVSGQERKTLVSYVKIQSGEIERSQWQSMVHDLIHEKGEDELFSQLMEWVQDHVAWLKTDAEQRNYALGLHARRIFDDECWVDFVPFNRKYRPEKLASAGLVPVVTECCGKECITTLSQIKKGDGKICYPYCGRFSMYAKKGMDKSDEQEKCGSDGAPQVSDCHRDAGLYQGEGRRAENEQGRECAGNDRRPSAV